MTPPDVRWQELLGPAMERVRRKSLRISQSKDRDRYVGVGASGDRTLVADKAAEEELLRALLAVKGLRVVSEEAGEKGDRTARSVAVVDPIDGSSNFQRGIPFYCSAVAVADGPTLSDVTFGYVMDLVTGDVYVAEKGKGARKNGKRIGASGVGSLDQAVVDVDMSRGPEKVTAALVPLISQVKRQVHYGANALELCYLAEGRVDAFVDLRRRMRVTDFAAPYIIAKEAGAILTDDRDRGLDPILGIGSRFSFVASGNSALHRAILDLCRGSG